MTTNGNGTARWQLWLTAAAVGLGVLAPIIGLAVGLALVTMTANRTDATVGSIQAQLVDHDHRINANAAAIGLTKADQARLEGEIRTSDELRNLTHAADTRSTALLWEKAFKTRYPSDVVYFPPPGRGDVEGK